jgi:hypothetical protein
MINYSDRLRRMQERRSLPGRGIFKAGSVDSSFREPAAFVEAYQHRDPHEKYQYALGAMQAIEPEYTRISVEEGQRVVNHLTVLPVKFELQGSVPLDIHIRASSDIDILALHTKFITFDPNGPKANAYSGFQGDTPLIMLMSLRAECERILTLAFPVAKVDTTGSKSISLTGGSLRRKIDLVPAHWHDTANYQVTKAIHDRQVRILDKDNRVTLPNYPFLHIKKVNDKDVATGGGAKKAIRLLKTLRRDCDREIKLTSYDIAALVWHISDTALTKPSYQEIALLGETLRVVSHLVDNPNLAFSLDTPDQSRKIFDTREKLTSLVVLRDELETLATDVAKEGAQSSGLTTLYERLSSIRVSAQ